MIEGVASRTAKGAAEARAAHQVFENGAIFHDPMALRILGKSEQEFREGWAPPDGSRLVNLMDFLPGRSRFAEDNLRRAVEDGVRQYVVLGAGLDTFAIRNPYAQLGLKVFEVDHPETTAW